MDTMRRCQMTHRRSAPRAAIEHLATTLVTRRVGRKPSTVLVLFWGDSPDEEREVTF